MSSRASSINCCSTVDASSAPPPPGNISAVAACWLAFQGTVKDPAPFTSIVLSHQHMEDGHQALGRQQPVRSPLVLQQV
eukprot:CAMPEP_0117682318 /NCGR_PEP_ID=MMETSP0804-20121206/19578_1 /TAXON_ID=1074897 /ORGANISM="Tetraselmis astigmatica, Strain CCMP880" /LENGTH=78 /DNA_ID=CAMNT_0005492387 /DNA_START=78 /DNA_END=314 /DNA_ORIENTATION=+